jgi:hypothetical protein
MSPDNPFEHFPARSYLKKYYSYVGDENAAMMQALAHFAQRFEPALERVAEVGGGPSVVPLLTLSAALSRSPDAITFNDICDANLEQVEFWLDRRPAGFAYDEVLAWLQQEHEIDAARITELVRGSAWTLWSADLQEPPVEEVTHRFDTISSHFFAESATNERDTLVLLLNRIAQLAAPDARVFLSFMRRSLGYSIDGIDFPAVPVDEYSLPQLLRAAGLELEPLEIITAEAEDPPTRPGYEGMLFVGGILHGRDQLNGESSR